MSEDLGEQPSSVSPGRPGSAIYPNNPLGEQYEGIATGRDVEWEPLVDFRRMDVSENTCLLYTSPSPRDATLSRMPSCA